MVTIRMSLIWQEMGRTSSKPRKTDEAGSISPVSRNSSLLPGHKLEWPIFTTAHPVPGHERVNSPPKTGFLSSSLQEATTLKPVASEMEAMSTVGAGKEVGTESHGEGPVTLSSPSLVKCLI